SPTSGSPPYLHLHHAAVVAHLHRLLAERFIVGDDLEVVAAHEVLQTDQVAGGAIARYQIARVELFDATYQLHPLRDRVVPREAIPPSGMHVAAAIVLVDVLGPRRPAAGPVQALDVRAGRVAVALECAAQVQAPDGRHHGAREVGHAVVGIDGAVRPLAVDHRGLEHQPAGEGPVGLHADVALGGIDDAGA